MSRPDPRALKEDRKDGRVFAPNDFVPSAFLEILSRKQFPIRDTPRIEFRCERNRKDGIVPANMGEFLRMSDMRDALVYSKNTANAKNVDSDEKGVKVEDLAMSEWMERISRPRTPRYPQKQ
jgi:hypothetical protein